MKTKGERNGGGAPECLRPGNDKGFRNTRGTHLRGDRKSSETIENPWFSVAPLRKRVCNRLITLGLEGCDRKERTWVACSI
jgi:hypothetical protein